MGLFAGKMNQPPATAPESPKEEAAPEPSKEAKYKDAKKIMEEHPTVFNFTYEDYEKQADQFNEIVNELGNKLEAWGVDMQPTALMDNPSEVMGLKDLTSNQKDELRDYLESKDALEVNKKWAEMEKAVADFIR